MHGEPGLKTTDSLDAAPPHSASKTKVASGGELKVIISMMTNADSADTTVHDNTAIRDNIDNSKYVAQSSILLCGLDS
jgi:hypothetical protein